MGSAELEKSRVKSTADVILFGVLGMSPGVVTETVWALAHEEPPVIPQEIIVLTTSAGREQILRDLFEERGREEESRDLALKLVAVFGFPTGDKGLDAWCREQFPDCFRKHATFETLGGSVAFMSAMPIESVRIVTDIVNCHHPDYYLGKQQQPYDNENPNPQFFPAVERGSAFEFIVRPLVHAKNVCPAMRLSIEDLMTFAEEVLREAAEEYGFGSKTSNGYGWFGQDTSLNEAIAEREAERDRRKEEESRIAALSPDEREAQVYLESLGTGDVEGTLKGKMRDIAKLEEQEQRSICLLLQGRFSGTWKGDINAAKKREKVQARVNSVRAIATKLGVELP